MTTIFFIAIISGAIYRTTISCYRDRPTVWTGVLWIIVMFLSAVWTLILTAPIHCRASTAETLMQCYISTNLMKKQTYPHLGWPEGLPGLTAAAPPSELKHSGCIKVNRCKCLMRDGSGLIDLASVADEDGFIQRLEPLPSAVGNTDVLLSFSPCLPFSQPEDFSITDCTDVAACVIIRTRQDNRVINQYLNYGRHEGNKFSYNESKKTLTVSYSMFPDSEPQTVVHYQCSPNHSITHSQSFSADGPLQMWVESPCACPNACALVDVGPGTIFLIILCISVTAYFIIGSCALRPFRTSNGVQMAPEDSVWCMICYQLSERPDGSRRKRNYSLTDTL